MASIEEHKKQILSHLVAILEKDDDLAPDEMALEGPNYDRWDRARNELVAEFDRRSGSPIASPSVPVPPRASLGPRRRKT